MAATIRISAALMAELERNLDRPELAAFLLADFDGRDFDVVELKPVKRNGYASRSNYHLELDDSARPELIAWALEGGCSLIEVHSHGPGFPQFSRSDHRGFADWVGHVRWRLRGRPYAALVRSGAEWDGLAWTGAAGAEAIEAIEVRAADDGPADDAADDGAGPDSAQADRAQAKGARADGARAEPGQGDGDQPAKTIKTTQRSIEDV
jgi:hypothetical protein